VTATNRTDSSGPRKDALRTLWVSLVRTLVATATFAVIAGLTLALPWLQNYLARSFVLDHQVLPVLKLATSSIYLLNGALLLIFVVRELVIGMRTEAKPCSLGRSVSAHPIDTFTPYRVAAFLQRKAALLILIRFSQQNHIGEVVLSHHAQGLAIRRPAESVDEARGEGGDLMAARAVQRLYP
jgi:hypothetical protein